MPACLTEENEVFDDWAERQYWEERQRTEDDHNADQHNNEQWSVSGQCSRARRDNLLAGQIAGECQDRHREPETAKQHDDTECRIIEDGIDAYSCERTAVIVSCRCEGVHDLAEAMCARVIDSGSTAIA